MSRLPEISGPSQPPASGDTPDALVVFLHGWGADGKDLIGLAPNLAPLLPGAHFVSPNAPYSCDDNPFGRQWFSLRDRDPSILERGAVRARAIIDRFLDDELARLGLGDDRLALVGFSQGTMMALYVALRREKACAAVVGFSGALIGAESLATELRAKPPVFLAHGDADPMVPFDSLATAVETLGAAGLTVSWHVARGVGHGIDPESLSRGSDCLVRALRG